MKSFPPLLAALSFALTLPSVSAHAQGNNIDTFDLPQLPEIIAVSVVLNDDRVYDAAYGQALEDILEAYHSLCGCEAVLGMPVEQVFDIRAAIHRYLSLLDENGGYTFTQLGMPQADGTVTPVYPTLPRRLAAHVSHFRENHMDTLAGLTAENYHPIMLQRMREFMTRTYARLRRAGAIR